MDGLLGFVQVDKPGDYLAELPQLTSHATPGVTPFWTPLLEPPCTETKTRGASAEWLSAGFGTNR